MPQVDKIILPNKPHLDPIAAYWLLLNYGQKKFNGIKQAKLAVYKSGAAPDQTTLASWKKENVLSLDIENGTYDHHEGNCCLVLKMADDLEIKDNPELQSLLRYVQEDDAAGLHNNFGELAGIIKAMYANQEPTEEVIKTTLHILNALQSKEKSRYVDAKEEYEKKAKLFKIRRKSGKIKLAVVKTNNPHVSTYAQKNDNVAIVILQNPLGHVFIFTNKVYRLNITNVVAAIRLREAQLNNKKIRVDQLKKPGKIQDVQNWFYHESLNALMNGSEALANTTPTKIALAEIVEIVVFGLSLKPTTIDPKDQERCQYYQNLFDQTR